MENEPRNDAVIYSVAEDVLWVSISSPVSFYVPAAPLLSSLCVCPQQNQSPLLVPIFSSEKQSVIQV
jgi:hypothetical protein